MDFLRRLQQQLAQIWQQMSLVQRVALVLLGALSLAVVIGVGFWSARTEYRVLFSGLSAEDAGAVTNSLQTQGVPFRLEAGGTTILVPVDRVSQLRLTLAVEGLPAKSGKGFELFDQSQLGMTPFTQHVHYLRALQGELARTIMQIDPVVNARVHVVRPEPSPFVREQKLPTASVMLRLKPGATLSRSVAAGIAALVSRAVEGLTPENVTLLDASGRVLSEPITAEAGLVASQLDYRRSLEHYLAAKAEDMLARVLGPGRAIVRVAADINFQRLKEKKESYDPDRKVIAREKITTNKTTSTSPAQSGVVGASANLPKGAGAATSSKGGTSSSQDETTETDYLVSKTIQETEDKFGAIDRLTIAAMVDLSKVEAPKDGAGKTAMRLADVEELIKQAVGFKGDRDQIKVSDVALPGAAEVPEPDAEAAALRQWQFIVDMVRNASLAVAALVAVILGWIVLRRRPSPPAAEEKPPPEAPPPEVPPSPKELSEREQASRRLATLAEQSPEIIAKVLASWLKEGPSPPSTPSP